MSQVHYKFKSSKDYDSITFDGHSISVFDLKREILIAKGLKGNDDLALTHADTGEEYHDDAKLIPRNTRILVARVPGKAGRSGAQKYLEGTGPIPRGGNVARNVFDKHSDSASHNAMNNRVFRNTQTLVAPDDGPPAPTIDTSNMTEEEAIKNMFQQSTAVWDKTQEAMANAPYRRLPKFPMPTKSAAAGAAGAGGGTGANASGGGGEGGSGFSGGSYQRGGLEQQQRPPPGNYVCFRCGQKGHWIQFCPTNSDKSFEPIGVKRTTGIPRSFLKTVEQVPANGKKGVMVTQDGNLVVATTNDSAWKKFHEKSKGSLTSDDLYATAPVTEELKCFICQQLLRNAVRTPCCQSIFCDECINDYLVHPPRGEPPMKCFRCRKDLVPDQLIPSLEYRQRVDAHLKDWAKRRYNTEQDTAVTSSPGPSTDIGAGPSNQPTTTTDDNKAPPSKTAGLEREGSNPPEDGNKEEASSHPKRGPPQDSNRSGDHQNDHGNKRPNTGYNNNRQQHQQQHQGMNNFNPMAGIPPEMLGMMGDQSMFMDPGFLAASGIPPFFMPGFGAPFGADFQGMQGGGGMPVIPGMPPMIPGQPGYQGIPRIGFSDNGRGRGRGGWQSNNFQSRGGGSQRGGFGRGEQHQQQQQQQQNHNGPMNGGGRGTGSVGRGGGANRSLSPAQQQENNNNTNSNSMSNANVPSLRETASPRPHDDHHRHHRHDRQRSHSRDRSSRDRSQSRNSRDRDWSRDRGSGGGSRDRGSYDDDRDDRSRDRGRDRDNERDRSRDSRRYENDDNDIDMSQVPKGPRDDHRRSTPSDDEIPTGPRAGVDPDDDDRRRRSPTPSRHGGRGSSSSRRGDDYYDRRGGDRAHRRGGGDRHSPAPSSSSANAAAERSSSRSSSSRRHHYDQDSRRSNLGEKDDDHDLRNDSSRSSRSRSRDYHASSHPATTSSHLHDRSRDYSDRSDRHRSKSPTSSRSSRQPQKDHYHGRDRERGGRDYERSSGGDRESGRGRDRDRKSGGGRRKGGDYDDYDDDYGRQSEHGNNNSTNSNNNSSKKNNGGRERGGSFASGRGGGGGGGSYSESQEEVDLFKTGLISSSARERERRERDRARRFGSVN